MLIVNHSTDKDTDWHSHPQLGVRGHKSGVWGEWFSSCTLYVIAYGSLPWRCGCRVFLRPHKSIAGRLQSSHRFVQEPVPWRRLIVSCRFQAVGFSMSSTPWLTYSSNGSQSSCHCRKCDRFVLTVYTPSTGSKAVVLTNPLSNLFQWWKEIPFRSTRVLKGSLKKWKFSSWW